MNLLLDTHAFLWSITSRRMSLAADAAFLDPDNSLYLSAASYWEICIKVSIGKLTLPDDTWPYERLHIWDIRLRQG